MKKIFTLTALVAASFLIATRSDSQVYVNANVGYPAGYGVAYEDEFPGYAYYDYPAWNGHYQDYYYYAHYRPFFERRYAGYFNGGRFDRGRFQRENYGRGYAYGGYANRGYVNRGNFNRGYGGQAYAGRGGFANHGGGFGNHGG